MGEESTHNQPVMDLDETTQLPLFESRAESPEIPAERPSINLSSFKPSKDTIREVGDGSVSVRLAPGERLVVLGQFEVCVQKGQITLMGSILKPSKHSYRVFASSSHSLPVMRCLATDSESAELRLHPCEVGLGSLEVLSPLFGRLWNNNSGTLGLLNTTLLQKSKESTFQILFSSSDGPPKAFLQPLISPPEWNEMLARCSRSFEQTPLAIMVCGPKSSGKSTFAKFLVNRLLSTLKDASPSKKSAKPVGVALLDLDPGQPEFSPPGQLSLVHASEPNFGPSFTHPVPNVKSAVIRSHSVAAISPSLDPSLYMACVSDLFAHYRNLLSTQPDCPLVINTPGWVFGTGLEILVELITQLRPSEIIYMSQDGPAEVVSTLREAAKSHPVLTIPSQVSEYTTRTAAHLRTMQSMSYFHLDSTRKTGLAWSGLPLTSIPPWEIKYSGDTPGLLGVICYGEQPPANLLADTINGSLVAVVVIDDMAAIPGWVSGVGDRDFPTHSQDMDITTNDTEIRAFDQDSSQPQRLERPLIIPTPDEGIPYFNPANTISINPRYSHSIGLALVRGIDVTRRRLQVLTPIPSNVIDDANQAGKSIVLISGKLDTPGWAYIEELTQKTALDKATRKQSGPAGIDDEGSSEIDASEGIDETENRSLGDGFQNAPWVDRLEGSRGRGIGARVWRVRRDLGRAGDGGD
ncbi:hypothetical protein N431DRAFT_345755 [Stipitochalara longipes BDJ]|nr:hypothetical protein N431DRAFT_345755 [Stipitochalara longipes BDJ]